MDMGGVRVIATAIESFGYENDVERLRDDSPIQTQTGNIVVCADQFAWSYTVLKGL